jgi:hypothetical protein
MGMGNLNIPGLDQNFNMGQMGGFPNMGSMSGMSFPQQQFKNPMQPLIPGS